MKSFSCCLRLLSSAVEQLTCNQQAPSSNLGGGFAQYFLLSSVFSTSMNLLVLGDLHYRKGNPVSELKLAKFNQLSKPDVLLLVGDNAEYDPRLLNYKKLFSHIDRVFDCAVVFVAGNHELWSNNSRWPLKSAEALLFDTYPKFAERFGVHYLESENFIAGDWTIAGTYGHYDYSLGGPLSTATFDSQRHTLDGRILHWGDRNRMCLERPSKVLCTTLMAGLEHRLETVSGNLITVSHTVPSIAAIGKPRNKKQKFFDDFSGTTLLADTIAKHQPRYHFCAHTHEYTRTKIGDTLVVNTGGGYNALSAVYLDTKTGKVERKVLPV